MLGHSAILANRVSYVLGLQGPSMTVDTACSSSLVALDVACGALRSSSCSLAVVASVNVLMSAASFVACCKARMLSPDAQCRVFDDDANGYVRAEGCGAVVLQSMSKCEGKQTPPYHCLNSPCHRLNRTLTLTLTLMGGNTTGVLAVVRGSALIQDGRSANLTSPFSIIF